MKRIAITDRRNLHLSVINYHFPLFLEFRGGGLVEDEDAVRVVLEPACRAVFGRRFADRTIDDVGLVVAPSEENHLLGFENETNLSLLANSNRFA